MGRAGGSQGDHCNAHAGMQCYRVLREEYKRNPQLKLAQPPSAKPLHVPRLQDPPQDDSGSSGQSAAPSSQASAGAAQRECSLAKEAWKPVPQSRLLPDPSLDKNLLEVGSIRLPIKVGIALCPALLFLCRIIHANRGVQDRLCPLDPLWTGVVLSLLRYGPGEKQSH